MQGKGFQKPSRRRFLGGASVALVPAISALSASRVIGANGRINLGFIGLGNRGAGHLRAIARRSSEAGDVQAVALSDVYARWKQRAQSVCGLADSSVHHDYRELLSRSDVDAVVISAPDHWHAQMTIDALAAGKDVYLEKPMTLAIGEARQVAEAVRKYGRVLQVGSGGVSDPRNRKARELIEAGEIGELLWAQASTTRNWIVGEWNYYIDEEATPQTIDWPRWLGPAPKRPFSAERFFRWRKYWDYSGGIATDLMYHTLGPLLYAMGPQFPVRAMAAGGIYVQKDREVPDTFTLVIEYPGFIVNLAGCSANAAGGRYLPAVIYGHKGTLRFHERAVVIEAETFQRGRQRAAAEPRRYEVTEPYDIWKTHMEDFLACMRSRKKPVLNEELGYMIMTAVKLGVDSYRRFQVLSFDQRTGQVGTGGPARPAYEGAGRNHPEDFPKRSSAKPSSPLQC